jgi:hypothetical protein
VTESMREGQSRSAFTAILETLCESCAGCVAVGLVDEEGESVDHATPPGAEVRSAMIAYDIKLAGAHWQIVMRQAADQPHLGGVEQLSIHAEAFDYVVRQLFAGYVLVLICRPGGVARVSLRALRQVEVELAREAGWPIPGPNRPYWRRVRVQLGKDGRPAALSFLVNGNDGVRSQTAWKTNFRLLEEHERPGFERTFRLGLPSGVELDLVREPSGYWYGARRANY